MARAVLQTGKPVPAEDGSETRTPAHTPTIRTPFAVISRATFAVMLVLLVVALLQKQKGDNGDPAFAGAVVSCVVAVVFATLHDLRVKRLKATR